MRLMDGWFSDLLGRVMARLPEWKLDTEWHEWYAWYPVRVHEYYHSDRAYPSGPTDGWAWLEPVWRRYSWVNCQTEVRSHHVIKKCKESTS